MKKICRIIILSGLVLCLAGAVACKDWKSLGSVVVYMETKDYQGKITNIDYQKRDPKTDTYYDAEKDAYGQFHYTITGRTAREEDYWGKDMNKKYGDNWRNKVTFTDKKKLWARTDHQLSPDEKTSQEYESIQDSRAEIVTDDWKYEMKKKYGEQWDEKVTITELNARHEKVLSVISNPSMRETENTNFAEETWDHEMQKKYGTNWPYKATDQDFDVRDARVLKTISDPNARAEKKADLEKDRQDIYNLRKEAEEEQVAPKPVQSHSKRAIGPYNPLTSGHGQSNDNDNAGNGGGHP